MPRPDNPNRPARGRLIAAAALYGAAELFVTLVPGRFFDWGRAEALLFFAFRPWLALAAALLLARLGWRDRLFFYACALILTALSQSAFLLGLGGSRIWEDVLRGLAAGGLLWALIDLLLQGGRRLATRWGLSAAAALAVVLFVVPGGLAAYEAVAIAREREAPAATRPELMLMTALPIIWGEGGAFDPGSRPERSYKALQREFDVRLLDVLDKASLGAGRLLLLAQPRALAPNELVALDQWVRAGGRVLILTDPTLVWPSDLPLGDVRRPPAIGLLGPLLSHWGLELRPGRTLRLETTGLDVGQGPRRLLLAGPGRFRTLGGACAAPAPSYLARCRVGRGRAVLLADADMLRDELWVGPGRSGDDRHRRISDNVLALADLLDRLGGVRRARIMRPVSWLAAGAPRSQGVALALLPLGIGLVVSLSLGRRRR